MGTLKINSKYSIGTDSKNFILYENHKVKDKESENYNKTILKEVGYYSCLQNTINRIAEQNILDIWPDLVKIIEINEKLLESITSLTNKLSALSLNTEPSVQ